MQYIKPKNKQQNKAHRNIRVMGITEHTPLFETKKSRGRLIYRSFATSLFVCICFVWIYRISHIIDAKGEDGKWVWLGMLGAEFWFGFYWVLTQAFRWNLVFRKPFRNILSQRCHLLLFNLFSFTFYF